MDLQTYINNATAAARKEVLASSNQLTLGEILLKLETAVEAQKIRIEEGRKEAHVRFDFEYLHPTYLDSWRGSYNEIAIGFSEKGEGPTLSSFYSMINAAIGQEYTGWKGGEYTMNKHTPVWVANQGHSGNTAVLDIVDDGYVVFIITGLREY